MSDEILLDVIVQEDRMYLPLNFYNELKSERDRLAAELAAAHSAGRVLGHLNERLRAELAEAQRDRDLFKKHYESISSHCGTLTSHNMTLESKLAEAQASLAKWKQIAENRRVDGRKAWDEVDRLKARIDEMIDANKWEVPK